jgi:hypothetical protein
VNCFYIASQRLLHRDWLKRILYLPGLMAVGIGMTVDIARSVLEGAIGVKSPFVRTPKYSVEGNKGEWKSKRYRGRMDWLSFVQIGLGIYFSYITYYSWSLGIYGIVPFLCMFQFGYFYTGLGSLMQSLKHHESGFQTVPVPVSLVGSKRELDSAA